MLGRRTLQAAGPHAYACGCLVASLRMSGVLLSAALQPERPRPQLQRQLLVQAQDPREEGKGCGLPFLWCKLLPLFRRSMHRAMVLLLLRAFVFLGRSLAHLVVYLFLRIFTPALQVPWTSLCLKPRARSPSAWQQQVRMRMHWQRTCEGYVCLMTVRK